jgi:hypothetical protein
MENFKTFLQRALYYFCGYFMVFFGVYLTHYFLSHDVSVISFTVGIIGVWILSPAIETWKDAAYYWYLKITRKN